MKRIICFIVLFIAVAGAQFAFSQNKTVKINLTPVIIKEVSSWDKRIVFFTSAMNPLTTLEDITNYREEVALQNIPISTLGENVIKLFRLAGLHTMEATDGSGQKYTITRVIDVNENPDLFIKNPKLRFFATWDIFEKNIVDTGGGVKIIFTYKHM
jgi:hypothetical protein